MTRYQILNAPSKWSLSVAFFDKVKDERRPVTFRVNSSSCPQSTEEIEVVINSLQWEDGSGESWGFKGFAVIIMDGDRMCFQPKVNGWFRTSDRKGWIDIDIPTLQQQPDADFTALIDQLKRGRC